MHARSSIGLMFRAKEYGMDDRRFDAWTRRRFGAGIAASGIVAAMASLANWTEPAGAKKKKKCKKNETRCGKKKCVKGECCPGKSCGEGFGCQRTVSGKAICIDLDFLAMCTQCNSNADCGSPLRCVKGGCGGSGVTAVCKRPCDAAP